MENNTITIVVPPTVHYNGTDTYIYGYKLITTFWNDFIIAEKFGINSIKENQLQMQNFINQGFSGLSSQLIGEFRNVDNAICTLGYQNQAGFNSLAHQISDCCCATQRAIDGVNYNMAKNTCDIVTAINSSNQRVIDYMQNEKICGLQAENVALKGQISNYNQTNAIVSALAPACPKPAYIVPNPNCCYSTGCTGVQ